MGGPSFLAIAVLAGAVVNLAYCAITVRANMAQGESGRAGLGVLACLFPLFMIGWALLLWAMRHMPG